ncbi:MAG: NHLP bacteriocin export ABC transporter permease/ATPase subunit [Acidobacteria bacterium]|nr:MAG: NHLP bacteriocin export ABC transporter permease/ATPase subunit [Acidobacteriota bacterium]
MSSPEPQAASVAADGSAPPPAATRGEEDAGSVLAALLSQEGEAVEAGGDRPFLIDAPDTVWWVEEGEVHLFVVDIEAGAAKGARSYFMTLDEGALIFGIDPTRYGIDAGFLAVGRMGTVLRRIELERLQQLALDDSHSAAVAAALDAWVVQLGERLTRDMAPTPVADLMLEPDDYVALQAQQTARSRRGVLWVEAAAGDLLFVSSESLNYASAPSLEQAYSLSLFPLSADTWVEGSVAEGEVVLWAHSASDVVGEERFWAGLQTFHAAVCSCEFINKRLATLDEFQRLRSKAEHASAAGEAALQELAAVMQWSSEPAVAATGPVTAIDDPLLDAAARIGAYHGMRIESHPDLRPDLPFADRLAMIAKASRFRYRQVVLREGWWKKDLGPLLATLQESGEPVALIPKGADAYVCYDPRSGETRRVNASLAEGIDYFAQSFYRPFPDGPLKALDLLRFGLHRMQPDVARLALMGILIGVLGALTPYISGQIFDAAIPQAERSLLYQFVAALLAAAFVRTAFTITQAIATLRMQGRMDYTIGAALWDRLLNLPSGFFRDFTAGDLAQRAAGINAIRDLLAGAGISAILGSLSSVFYLFLMFKYSVRLGLVAVGLTALFIGVTVTVNYWQLHFQRQMMASGGRISGLVLQLISGVAKLRVSGAENHAFRTWAAEFSDMRRLGFKVGRIQNFAEVFNGGFGVLSAMAIYFTLVSLRAVDPVGLSTGEFIAFNAAYGAFLAASMALSQASLNMLRVVPIYERLKPIVTTEPEVSETKSYPGRLSGEIELAHVHFRYDEEGPWILRDITLKIRPGEFVAFVGGSGSGKSTLMRVMLGFEIPQKGSTYYDGQELDSLDIREVRQQLGVVLQNSQLLPAELYRNIIGNSATLTVDDAWEAARMAGLEDDIKAMPMKMHTYISDGGGGLSGGQKQRLLIARAIVHRPRILFMDEATSALDNRTQAMVTKSIDGLQATRIVIAHRLSTIRNADRICVLDQGVIAEQGSYDELIALGGKFAQLAARQHV